jgi:hypothetical protein
MPRQRLCSKSSFLVEKALRAKRGISAPPREQTLFKPSTATKPVDLPAIVE